MSGRQWFGCIICGVALLVETGCQAPMRSGVVSSKQPCELRHLNVVAEAAEASSVRAQSQETILHDSGEFSRALVPDNQETSVSPNTTQKSSGYSTTGSGRLGKPYVSFGISKARSGRELFRSVYGDTSIFDASVNVPINQIADLWIGGSVGDSLNQSTVVGFPTTSTAQLTRIAIGFNQHVSDTLVVNPYFGVTFGYNTQNFRSTNQIDPSDFFEVDAESFTWTLKVGCETNATERMSVRLGIYAGGLVSDDRSFSGPWGSREVSEPEQDDFDPGIVLSSAVWLNDRCFIAFGANFDFDDDVSFGVGGGFGY